MVGVDGHVAEAVRTGVYCLTNHDELLRLRVVREAEQDVPYHGEHEDVGADAEGEGKKSGRAKRRAATQLANSKTEFAEKPVHGSYLHGFVIRRQAGAAAFSLG
jgi:hypothetical protein